MTHRLVTITPAGHQSFVDYPKSPELAILQAAAGGFIQEVPGLKTFFYEGKNRRVNAWVDEEGLLKGYAPNPTATALWRKCLEAVAAKEGGTVPFVQLVGNLVLVFKLS